MGRFTLFQPNWEKWIFCLPAQQNEFCLHVAGKIHILLRHPMSCRFMLNSIFLAFFWTLFLGKKKWKKPNLCWLDNVKFHCSRLKFQFFLRKKKHVWYISWVGPPPFSVKIKGSPQAQQPHPRVQPPSLPAAAATWEWWVTKGRWGWNSTQLMWIHWVNGHFRESGGTYHKDP